MVAFQGCLAISLDHPTILDRSTTKIYWTNVLLDWLCLPGSLPWARVSNLFLGVDLSWTLDWRRTGGIVLLHESSGERRCYLTTHRLLVRTFFSAFWTFFTRLVAMCADINSRRGIVNPSLANLDLAVTNCCVFPDFCRTTEYTTAPTPFVEASPKVWTSTFKTGSRYFTIGRGMVSSFGSDFSHPFPLTVLEYQHPMVP